MKEVFGCYVDKRMEWISTNQTLSDSIRTKGAEDLPADR